MNNNTILISSTPCIGFVKTAGGTMVCIVAKGQVVINVDRREVHLSNVLYVPDANINLMSVQALANDGVRVTFKYDKACLEWPDGREVHGHANPRTRHWEILPSNSQTLTTTIDDDIAGLPDRCQRSHA